MISNIFCFGETFLTVTFSEFSSAPAPHQISHEEQLKLTVYKVPTHSEYLIEHDSIGPSATQKMK